jgi:hypothetical protein
MLQVGGLATIDLAYKRNCGKGMPETRLGVFRSHGLHLIPAPESE